MLQKKPKVIVFDIGGVLLDWKEGLKSTASLLKITPEEIHKMLQMYLEDLELGKISEEDFWKNVANEYKYTGNSHELAKVWIEGQPLIESGWSLLRKLKNNYRLSACTNNWLGVVENQIKDINDFRFFEIIIDSSQEKVRKPDNRMFRIVEERLNEHGSNIFLIDDSHGNCEAAKQFGWQVFEFDPTAKGGETSCDSISKLLLS